jgi:hypothetical protein
MISYRNRGEAESYLALVCERYSFEDDASIGNSPQRTNNK